MDQIYQKVSKQIIILQFFKCFLSNYELALIENEQLNFTLHFQKEKKNSSLTHVVAARGLVGVGAKPSRHESDRTPMY